MSLPHNMPKPPPKGLPPGLPGKAGTLNTQTPAQSAAPRPQIPAQATPIAVPVPAPVAPAATTPVAQAAAPRAPFKPRLDIPGLTPSMTAMMEAVQIYDALLVEENALLRTGDSAGVAALLDRKMNATRLYQERQRAVLGDQEATRSLTAEQRAEVVTMVRSLEELARENTILLKANMSAIEQLFEVINTAARKMRKREVSYSQAGVIRDYHNAHTVSLAYNHSV
jgi:hypothetical protein